MPVNECKINNDILLLAFHHIERMIIVVLNLYESDYVIQSKILNHFQG